MDAPFLEVDAPKHNFFQINIYIIISFLIFASVLFSQTRDWLKAHTRLFGDMGPIADLRIPETYSPDYLDLDSRRDKYENTREELRLKYCTGPTDDEWMYRLDEGTKGRIKFLLMVRTVATLHIYEIVEKEVRGCSKLYRVHVITKKYWDSVVSAHDALRQELDLLRDDMILLDPECKPAEVFGEAWHILSRHGPRWPENMPPPQCPPDCQCEKSKQQRAALAEAKAKAQARTEKPNILGPFGNIKKDGYVWQQSPPPNGDELEIQIPVPAGTQRRQVDVKLTVDTICVILDGTEIFKRSLQGKISIDRSMWEVTSEPIGPGDDVLLSGLTNNDFNGLRAQIHPTTSEQRGKGRWRVVLEDKRDLSVKEANLIVQTDKGRVVISLVKLVSAPWPNPPWKEPDSTTAIKKATYRDEGRSKDEKNLENKNNNG